MAICFKQLLLFMLLFPISLFAFAQGAPIVQLASGSVRGIGGVSTEAFLGIPFAAPPVGELRWASPANAKQWNGLFEATHTAASCAQLPSGDGPGSGSEDCLYLDIYRPAAARPTAKLPVMVFFHGGGNISGTPAIYDGQRMAEIAHAIVVIPAYRLGVFGLLALPELGADAGTYLLQDQLAALRWVQAEIPAFGGDSGDVTLSGESSGAMDVCGLLASPLAAGLFRQAILQSGFCLSGPSLKDAQLRSEDTARKSGCNGTDVLPCMKKKSVADLLAAGAVGLEALSGPAYGGKYLPKDAASAVREGEINKVPVLLGFNRDELWPFQHGLYPLSPVKYEQLLAERYQKSVADLKMLYPAESYPHREYAIGAMAGDSFMICPILRDARALAGSVKVSVYEFAEQGSPPFKSLGLPLPRPPGYQPGAFHTAELQYLYNYQSAEGPLSFEQRQLGDRMIRMWVSFNRETGGWPSFQGDRATVVRFGDDTVSTESSTVIKDEHHCDFWDSRAAGVPDVKTR